MILKTQQKIVLIVIWIVSLGQGCAGSITSAPSPIPPAATKTPSPVPFLARQKEIPNAYMNAELIGKLIIVDGCIRLLKEQDSHLIIWPRDFSLRVDGETIEILDGAGQVVARVGDILMISGGERPSVEGFVLQPLPKECATGPFWVAGNEIRRLE